MLPVIEPVKYQLNDIDKTRIQPLLCEVTSNSINLKYLVTIDYWFPMRNYNRVIQDTKEDRKLLRSFFKSDIRLIGFIEKHTNPEHANFGGYHRHYLVSEIPAERWLKPTPRMENWMLNLDPEMVFSVRFGVLPTPQQQMDLVKAVLTKLHSSSVSQGRMGVDVREIYDLEGVLSYCSKQFEHYHPSYEVIAPNSDINLKHFIEKKQYGTTYCNRQETIPA